MAKYLRYMCAKSLQSCPTPCDPMDRGPPGSSIQGSLQAYNKSGLLCPPPGGFLTQRLNLHLSYISYIS